MTLPELSIKRPVFATVLSLVLVLVGSFLATRPPSRAPAPDQQPTDVGPAMGARVGAPD